LTKRLKWRGFHELNVPNALAIVTIKNVNKMKETESLTPTKETDPTFLHPPPTLKKGALPLYISFPT